MKNFSLGMIAAILLLVCCTGSTRSSESETVTTIPTATPIATGKFGVLSKYKDGYNTVYIYENGSGAASITSIRE